MRRARRIARARKFADWFVAALPSDIDAGAVENAVATALDPVTGEELWQADVTKKVLQAPAAPETDTAQASLKASAKGATRAARRQRQLQQRASRARKVTALTPTEFVLCA